MIVFLLPGCTTCHPVNLVLLFAAWQIRGYGYTFFSGYVGKYALVQYKLFTSNIQSFIFLIGYFHHVTIVQKCKVKRYPLRVATSTMSNPADVELLKGETLHWGL
ncbi:hypothetical protein COCSADRAFT_277553 [Bipolaris sorokiniana ND90Pr]|uniref:Uncharacterized protein n=1 Tax=Cochliobolus sativus (strain ND90Pr / ATCC 201652) TaxID=665912 RepID=M2SNV1_COCSN|nr:uncharacterized protein COCSADRAFT_277553 [Bipolaris sorokiniana ND90Pr]EMD68868.1 hypothetical protein COCSADRAFT_277553 [Bipolaris sorokiniana ND90Pr]